MKLEEVSLMYVQGREARWAGRTADSRHGGR